MSCCPAKSWGALSSAYDSYSPKGKVEREGDLDIYVVGEPKDGRCVVWNYDIFGFDGGRTRMLCDLVADCGFLVVMPDFYRGTFFDPSNPGIEEFVKDKTQWSDLHRDLNDLVLPFARRRGANSFGSIGFCWGTYVVVRASSLDEFKAGVSAHPSHTKISGLLREDEKELLKGIKCPQLFMPAGNDDANTKIGGLASIVLGDLLTVHEFPDMLHGWMPRGDVANETVKRDLDLSMRKVIEFFNKNL